jgi:N6-adenosine-specific RNA methylase IME4
MDERTRWADSITAAWRSTLEAVFETGRLLCEAKAVLEYGQWLAMIASDLPFSARTTDRLMAIYRDQRLADETHVSFLPTSWGTLYEITRLDDDTFDHLIEIGVINPECERADITAALKADKRKDKVARIARQIKETNEALPEIEKVYGVILADPPWQFEPYSRETGMDRAADNHYPTATIDKIIELAPPAADDAVLFLWATVPMLLQAIDAMEQWGFSYKSHWIWHKDQQGTGYWSRNVHELLLIGTRGEIPAPLMGTQPLSVIDGPVGEHSVKPPIFHELVERFYPDIPKLEMYARSDRPGWEFWGAEAPGIAA